MKSPIPVLRKIGHLEAISFLVLVGAAMPMKYFFGMPLAVRIVGMIHGVLFVAFCISLAWTTYVARWPLRRAALIFVAALFPIGPFLMDRKMRSYEEEFHAAEKPRVVETPSTKA